LFGLVDLYKNNNIMQRAHPPGEFSHYYKTRYIRDDCLNKVIFFNNNILFMSGFLICLDI